ncbi:MAG: zinc ribbon domain-containing protein, partial [Candidatus Delongbacteria bacterium]
MFEDLKWLVDLQKLDNEIYQLTSEERNMDSHISRMKHEIEEMAIKRVKLIRRQRELQEDKDNYDADILDHRRILDQKQIDLDNDKKTKKEHIKREVKKLEKAVEVFEERVSEFSIEIESIILEIATIDKNILKIEKIIRSENKKKLEIEKSTRTNLEKLLKKKDQIEKLVRIPFLNHYNRIMKIRNGIAITFVTEEGLCNGCKIHIPYQLQQKIKLKDDYNICEGCGRILVDIEMLAPPKAEKK